MKRGGDTPTRSSRQNKRACNGGETTESFIAGDLHEDCNQHVCSELSDEVASDLHRSVVSIALSKGNKVVFACSGIALQWRGFSTRFLTSVSLVRALFDAREGVRHHIAIEVRHEGDKVHTGFLAEYSFQHNWAVVVVVAELDVHIALLRRAEEVLPHSSVMALGRDTTGKIITRSVILTNDLSLSEGPERVVSPTCDVCEVQVCQGGPLFYSDGSFVGMNLCLAVEATYFLQWSIILERLERYWTISRRKKAFPLKEILKAAKLRMGPRHNSVCRDVSNEEQFRGLDSMGYPKQPKVGMFLANNFEETFGNKYDEGVWSLLTKKASSNVNRNVVALASFNGETRFFACTGFFIEWDGRTVILTSASLVRNSDDENKIKENLKIQVFVQSNRCIQGTLEHYDLHYNVALVGVKDYRVLRPAIAQPDFMKCTSRLLAVGRCFKSGTLMASCGLLTDWTGRLDCKYLYYSSCKTTKAGIGGPLVDLEGRFLGMNFYDKKIEGTPFLVWNDILKVLAHFKETRTETEVVNGGASYWTFERDRSKQMNRWPVPKPHWRYGCKRVKVESQDEDAMKKSGTSFRQGRGRYGYINGMRYLYL